MKPKPKMKFGLFVILILAGSTMGSVILNGQQQVGWNVAFVGGPKTLGPHPVYVYVADTGLQKNHKDLNVGQGKNLVSGEGANPEDARGSAWDCNGHGTIVAGVLGAKDNAAGSLGIVSGIEMFSLRVVDCSGSAYDQDVVRALEWLIQNASRPAVVNLSFQNPPTEGLEEIFRRGVDSGIVFVLATSQQGIQVPDYTCHWRLNKFAFLGGVIAVAGVQENETEWGGNDFGCVDLWAPASPPYPSTTLGGGVATIAGGNSGAAPHVTAAAALLLSHEPWLAPADVEQRLKDLARRPGTFTRDGKEILIVDISQLP